MVLSSTSLKLGAVVTSVVVANKRGSLRGSNKASFLEAEAGLGTLQCADFPDFTLKKACGAADVKGKTISLMEVWKWRNAHTKESQEWEQQPAVVNKLVQGHVVAEIEKLGPVLAMAESNDENERKKHEERMFALTNQMVTITAHPDALIGSCCPSKAAERFDANTAEKSDANTAERSGAKAAEKIGAKAAEKSGANAAEKSDAKSSSCC